MSETSGSSNEACASDPAGGAAAVTTRKGKKDRPCKTQMKQSSLEANDITLGRQDSWRRRICERTRRSRSTEEDYGDNTNDLSNHADLIEERLYLGNGLCTFFLLIFQKGLGTLKKVFLLKDYKPVYCVGNCSSNGF